jgi:hypothetical protein
MLTELSRPSWVQNRPGNCGEHKANLAPPRNRTTNPRASTPWPGCGTDWVIIIVIINNRASRAWNMYKFSLHLDCWADVAATWTAERLWLLLGLLSGCGCYLDCWAFVAATWTAERLWLLLGLLSGCGCYLDCWADVAANVARIVFRNKSTGSWRKNISSFGVKRVRHNMFNKRERERDMMELEDWSFSRQYRWLTRLSSEDFQVCINNYYFVRHFNFSCW